MTRRFFAPEVVQTSQMDCGPAALKCLLDGFGVGASYGRLREACQTDVDGTSIDTLEEVARELGLDAEQTIVPVDQVLLEAAGALPAIVVVVRPNGCTHFVVAWRRVGGWVQVMDPAVGRRWMRARDFQRELFVHEATLPADAWSEWARGDEHRAILRSQASALGVVAGDLVARATEREGWRGLAELDAAMRQAASLLEAGALRRGAETERAIRASLERADASPGLLERWSAIRPASSSDDGEAHVRLRGAVLVRARSARAGARPASPELAAALAEAPVRPARELWRLLAADGLTSPAALIGVTAVAAGGVVAEAVLLRSTLDVGRELGPLYQRGIGVGLGLVLVAALAMLDRTLLGAVAAMGRTLEGRLRIAFLSKLPRLSDRYFSSRTSSDMAERSHAIHRVRELPALGHRLLSSSCQLAATALGLAWLDPSSAHVSITAAVAALLLPWWARTPLVEHDLRVRTHDGSLAQFQLDALLGLVAVRSHGGEQALRREHEALLVQWVRAARALVATAVTVEATQALVGLALAAWILSGTTDAGSALLVVYWALAIPTLGRDIAASAREYPGLRNVTLRLLEPLGAPDNAPMLPMPGAASTHEPSSRGVALAFQGVRVVVGGHVLLDELELAIEPGEHVAIVGPSGAGKSTLAGLLLGWHRPTCGSLTVDGVPLDDERLTRLRRETAWVDPAIQLWNRSFVDNLQYGIALDDEPTGDLLTDAELHDVVERLPDGLATELGESGRRLSGGEGQRVRFGRALTRSDARLVILDEPFRGLDRDQRRRLLARARARWAGATLLCVSHDVRDTLELPRVLVIDGGHVVEDGVPSQLAAGPSRYRALLSAEQTVRAELLSSGTFRSVSIEGGRLVEPSVSGIHVLAAESA